MNCLATQKTDFFFQVAMLDARLYSRLFSHCLKKLIEKYTETFIEGIAPEISAGNAHMQRSKRETDYGNHTYLT